jgi:hypothetical protein
MEDGTERFIYIIREKKIERSRRCRKSDRYSGVNLKYFRIYRRQYNN